MQPHRGTTILLLGIIACCGGCFLAGLPAWVMANNDLPLMDAGRMDAEGRGLTQAGKVCGIIGTGLTGVALLASVLIAASQGN
jgi:hypothetical protein